MAQLTKTTSKWELRAATHEILSMCIWPKERIYTGADLLAMLVISKLPTDLREETNKFTMRTVGFEGDNIVVRLEMA